MTNQPTYKKLFEPCRIGRMDIRNRIVMPPMNTNYGGEDCRVTQHMKDYYEARARGGAGLVIVEAVCVDFPEGTGVVHELNVSDDSCIAGLTELAEVIRKHGARAAIQLHHAGRDSESKITGLQPVAPSPIPMPGGGEMPREMSSGEIEEIVSRFARAAERVRKAGFDGVEIHGAADYLIAEFLSPAANKRADKYGGSLENRARLLRDVIKAVRDRVGADYPVWCRLNGMEYGVEGGLTREDCQEIARLAERAGADAIHLGMWGIGAHQMAAAFPSVPGALLSIAEGIKRVVTVPLVAVGRLTPEVAEQALHEGKADLTSMGRALIADPDLPNKVEQGRASDIVPCIACLRCGVRIRYEQKEMRCTVNPACGREEEYRIRPAETPKRVLVVGGGPAGMEAARVAALRGHQVTLCERSDRLGGQLHLAAIPPGKRPLIEPLASYLAAQMENNGIAVKLNTEVDQAMLRDAAPEVVVVAAGMTPFAPQILGIAAANVVLAEDVLTGKAQVGDRVVIIGGELVGCETA
ncbi:MAG: FAD-dependent oxidoreductase, partial [Dehalococcoidia bacterium]|nr:FAD-dependent oxidoreductase [Dehalococcoidia bacterium]